MEPEKNLTSDLPKPNEISTSKNISALIALSLVFGIIGSVLGNSYVIPYLSKRGVVSSASITSGDVKNVQVNEQSGVIDVVKQASPAVVSIIISKDLNKLPGGTSSPFNFGPFSLDP